MRILITGCGGMLGEAVYAKLKDEHDVYATDIDLNESWLDYLDVRSLDSINKNLDMVRPNIIIHLAALVDMEYCELNPGHAYDVNFMGTYNMTRAAIEFGVPLVYISSAGVFDGEKQSYAEGSIPNPLNVYAKSKYAGELAAHTWAKSIVIRAGWMMGGGPLKDKKFVNKIIKQIRSGTKKLFVVQDKLGTPTYTYDLAETISHLLTNKMYGLFHGACDGSGSRVDITREILRNLGLEEKVTIQIVNSDYFEREYFARRPASEILESYKLDAAPAWQSCLADYLNRFEWKV